MMVLMFAIISSSYYGFERGPKYSLYYMDINKANVNGHRYLSTAKKEKLLFFLLDKNEMKQLKSYKNDVISVLMEIVLMLPKCI